ncbi:suppressor of cytokine signaling 7 isoform X3 [Conger conger]|uniref:suppressor of cytokine signaling 7 isoform X3 n=1 Tax=Conger conger TaxID=82655 RepID=UPI002A5AAE80|nr:suppressor of cytokine signaling 7 isoform X3 [Conger conger]
MNNAKDMSPDFVLMRLVSGAEDDRLDEENGNLSSSGGVMAGFGKAVLGHRGNNIKNGFELDLNNTTGPVRPSPSSLYSSQRDSGTLAPDSGVMVTRPPMPDPPPPVAQSFQHRAGRGARPQLMVFRNLLGDGDGILECGPEQPAVVQSNETDGQDSSPASVTTSGINNSINCGVDVQQQNHLSQRPPWNFHPRVKSDVIADGSEVDGGGDGGLCPRHRVTDPNDWPPLLSFGILNPRWACTAGEINSHIDDPVFDLARKFGDLGVDQASKILFKDGELPQCPCQTILASAAAGIAHGDDPAETSDALLVLEGLGTEEVDGLGINNCSAEELNDASCPAFALNGKEDMVQKMTEAFSSRTLTGLVKQAQRLASDGCSPAYRDPQVCCSRTEMLGPRPQLQPGANHTELLSGLSTPVGASPCGSAQDLQTTAQSRTATPKLLADRASMSLSSRSIQEEGEKATRVSRKSRKGSFKIRLGKLFRTKNTSVSMNVLDKRPSLASSTSSTGSLMDVWSSTAGDQDAGSSSQPSRTHSAFSPGPFSPVFTDTFLRALPRPNPSQADAPPPSQSGPPPLLCPLTCPDASSFATSLRELEKCGWYWGPMNWEDAEMKLKGKPDGSFLVRDSSDPRYILSLSFRSQNITHHTRMEHYRGTFSLWCHPRFEDRCHSVVEFIERAIMHSKNGKFLYFLRSRVPGLPPTPVQLLYPVSRFSNIKSLQHLCRFRIRQLVRIDHIQELPLPKSLIDYLRKFYYYDPEEEMYLSIKEARRGMGVEPVVESQT